MDMDILIDSKTPTGSKLRGIYKQSFAFYTLKERLPIILTRVIDYLVRQNETPCRNLTEIIGLISNLKYELQTNKPMRLLLSSGSDETIWNNFLMEETHTYFQTVWLYAECYVYRRLKEAFNQCDLDPFRAQKVENFQSSNTAVKIITAYLQQPLCANLETFSKFIKLSLWGNVCDLSLSLGSNVAQTGNPFEALDAKILVNQSEDIWNILKSGDKRVIIVTDNAGYELFTDLALADYLISTNLAKEVRFHIKNIPWFISDVNLWDFNYVVDNCDKKWRDLLQSQKWVIEKEAFWTLPFEYAQMETKDPDLYFKLTQSDLIIFKGDLNYRKLLGDINWNPETDFKTALSGFCPSNICALRTNKADLIAGIPSDVLAKMEGSWLTSGEFGIIQLATK